MSFSAETFLEGEISRRVVGKLNKPQLIELAEFLDIDSEGLVKGQLTFKILESLYESDRLPEKDCEWMKERLREERELEREKLDRAERLERERLEKEERLEREKLDRDERERVRERKVEVARIGVRGSGKSAPVKSKI